MTMSKNPLIDGRDLPIVKLVPRSERKVKKRHYQRIEASLRAVGLIDPLLVHDQGGMYEILDGRLRYRILLDLGVEMVPCLIWKEREAFTGQSDGQPPQRFRRDADAPQVARGARREDHRRRVRSVGHRPPAQRPVAQASGAGACARRSRRGS